MLAPLLLVLASLVPHSRSQEIRVDAIERNRVYEDDGISVRVDQVIFWDWNARLCEEVVVDWIHTRYCGPIVRQGGQWQVDVLRDRKVVVSRIYRSTHTWWDPEQENLLILPGELRRGLVAR